LLVVAEEVTMLMLSRFHRARRQAESDEKPSLRERGAAALEFALIAPFFFLVVFGGIEVGYMFRSNLSLNDTARNAARVASVARGAADADEQILREINRTSTTLNGDIARVVIFIAPSLDSDVPANCIAPGATSSQPDSCNVYDVVNGDLQAVIDGGPNEIGIQAGQRGQWANVGIHIEYDYSYVTGFFDSITLSATSVEVIELDL